MQPGLSQERPLVSICIPLYNHERYVEGLLDTINSDPYPNKQIVVLDDGSTDGSFEKLIEWKDRVAPTYPCLFGRQENQGVAKTLNTLLGTATGEFCTLIASDDLLEPGSLGLRIAYLEEHPGLTAVFGDARVIDQDGKQVRASSLKDLYHANKGKYESKESLLFQIAVKWSVPGGVLLARREELIRMGGFSTELTVEDYDLYLRLADARRIGFLDQTVASYRIHDSNLSRLQMAGRSVRREILRTCLLNFRRVRPKTRAYLLLRMGITAARWALWELRR